MVGWKEFIGKKVFIEIRNGRHPFQGKVIGVDDSLGPNLVFVTIIDLYGKHVRFAHSEIVYIKEEQ